MVTIRGYGAYVPLYRIERTAIAEQHGDYAGGGETAVPAHDEDVVSLAVSAAKHALDHAGVDGTDLDAVYAATTSDPFDERGVAPHVGYAVGADGAVRTGDFQGSARAATNALLAADDTVTAGRAETALVVAADVLHADPGTSAEQTAGAGAGALVVGPDSASGVATVEDAASETTGFVGRFKRAGSSPQEGDGRFNRENYLDAVTGAVERLGDVDPDHAAVPEPDGGWGDRALSALDLDAESHGTFDAVGFAGAGSILLDTVAALDAAAAGDRVLLAAYGPGGSDAVELTVTDVRDQEMTLQEYLDSKEYVTYAKHRDYRELEVNA